MTVLEKEFSRRDFLKGTGALVVAFSVPHFLVPKGVAAPSTAIGPALVDPSLIDSWLAVGGDGLVTVYTGKVELGTGTATAQLQLVADELDVAMSKLSLIQSDTWHTVDQGYTAGSQTLKTEFATGLRIVAAEARLALLNLASSKLGAPVSQLTVDDGVVSVQGDTSRSINYAELIGNQKFNLKITGKAKLKTPDQYKVVGTSVKRIDIPDKILGRFTYTQDVRVPGMLHGRVVRPPSLDAKLISVDGFGSKKMAGVKVVTKHNFVGVVAATEWQAIGAAAALQVTWQTTPLPDQATIYDTIRASPALSNNLMVNTGNVDKVLAGAAKQLAATYYWPYQMHGSMGTSCAVVDVQSNEATVWTSSQGVYPLRDALATVLNLPARNIHVIYVEGSGCYGLNGADNVVLDAAIMSQAVGKPVRVQYMRHDEHGWENYGSAMVMHHQAGLDASGNVIAWAYENWSAGRGGRPGPPGTLPTGVLAGFPEQPLTPAKPLPATLPAVPDPGPDNSNAITSYTFPSHRIISHSVQSRFFSGPLRSPGRIQNTFSNETFMDELAASSGQDPVAFRLKHLSDPRLIAVLQGAAKLAHWSPRPSPKTSRSGRFLTGRGIAAMQYEGVGGAYAAVVVQVQVDTKTGKVTVQHVWAAQDCGLTVNPDGMRAQAEGCVIQGVSRALKEEVKWTSQRITTQDWATYPVLRFPEMPQFDFQIINRPDQPVVGAGEVVVTAMPGAIGNAIFDATGKRLRQVPFTPARVRAAIAK
jgi:CO/xanthine dehydrogenase Mo-binding subunit